MATRPETSLYDCPNCPEKIEIEDPIHTRELLCRGCGSRLLLDWLDLPGSRFMLQLAPLNA